jgi:DNA-directed DNA polymerase III PolC
MIFDDCVIYDDYEPAGVELPETQVDEEKLKELGLNKESSNLDLLYELSEIGLKERGISGFENKETYFKRCNDEIKIFDELGFVDYILLNWDVLNFCHENSIPTGAGRGSAAGSLVLFLLGVTDIDPIPHGLFFERFVSKTRAKRVKGKDGKEYLVGSLLPDVDSDISYDQRHKVISYIERKHQDKTAKILTFNTFSSKLCIKEAVKYFEEASDTKAMKVSDSIPKLHGKVLDLEVAVGESPKFESWVSEHKETFLNALKVQGLPKNTGVHPSGIAICSKNIIDVVPLQKTKDGDLITGYNMDDVADLMVKFDILGLRTLTIAHKTCEKACLSIDDIDPTDPFIYKILQDFKYPTGLFQISAETNSKVCRKIKPEDINELSDVIALARPAALEFVDTYKNQKINPSSLNLNENLDEILSWSKNVILYQEQIMLIANKVFGLTLEEAETLRRIVGKKKVDEMPQWRERIFKAAEKKNLNEEVAEFYWSSLQASAHYSFNKSHSFAYADLAAKTVYLKHKYPQEFFLSVLECSEFEPEPLETINLVSQELPAFGMKLLPPCLYRSNFDFKVEGGDIRYGLKCIKGVSGKNLKNLIDFRGLSFTNKYEIFMGAKECSIPINIVSSLIQAGLMDFNFENKGKVKRTRTVLEAQSFNLLTDREKRNFIKLAPLLGFDILKAIQGALLNRVLADDNKVLMTEKRFNTFLSKYARYREMYDKNKIHEKFASWTYENSLLGFTYSSDLKGCFEDDKDIDNLNYLKELKDLADKETFSAVALVRDFFVRESQANNKYMIITLGDDTATEKFLFGDNSRDYKFSEFMESANLKKTDVVFFSGNKSGESFFIQNMEKRGPEIYMYKRQVKEAKE